PRSAASATGPAAPPITASTTSTTEVAPAASMSSPSPQPPPSSPDALPICQQRLAQYAGRANPLHVTLVAAYASTAADVVADDERRDGRHRSSFRDRDAKEFEAVCWFDADA